MFYYLYIYKYNLNFTRNAHESIRRTRPSKNVLYRYRSLVASNSAILVHRPATTSDRDRRISRHHISYTISQQDSLEQIHPISIYFVFISSI
ncbi:hypothetical protein AR158_c433R [Paramecium bursaria Chlorella virus AR158]|uniref:hypothetical protein n=1 Tax=Paramecium bursaria Chlorella virus AR158 TaxID=380598 RepID=UPI00015AA6D7|nr:hypothetical protein AR158_c433R [Paramecium bursaria Chlorella virus AR158]ABU43978.1 hypothetical protein AR158_c433R [Paramecium bursaria Chlorella virus AR158]